MPRKRNEAERELELAKPKDLFADRKNRLLIKRYRRRLVEDLAWKYLKLTPKELEKQGKNLRNKSVLEIAIANMVREGLAEGDMNKLKFIMAYAVGDPNYDWESGVNVDLLQELARLKGVHRDIHFNDMAAFILKNPVVAKNPAVMRLLEWLGRVEISRQENIAKEKLIDAMNTAIESLIETIPDKKLLEKTLSNMRAKLRKALEGTGIDIE